MNEERNIVVEIPAIWFSYFVKWLGAIPIVSVPSQYVVAVHRVFGCFEESYEEYYGKQLSLFKESKDD